MMKTRRDGFDTFDVLARNGREDEIDGVAFDWVFVAASLKKRLNGNRRHSEDALQEALAIYWLELSRLLADEEERENDRVVGLAIFRAAGAVNQGRQIPDPNWQPKKRKPAWECELRKVDRVPGNGWEQDPETGRWELTDGPEETFLGVRAPTCRSYRAPLDTTDFETRLGLISRQEWREEGLTEQQIDELLTNN